MSKYIIDYDARADAAYIKISGSKVEDSIEVNEGFIIGVNKKGQLVGIEVLNFSSTKLNITELLTRQFENLVSVVK